MVHIEEAIFSAVDLESPPGTHQTQSVVSFDRFDHHHRLYLHWSVFKNKEQCTPHTFKRSQCSLLGSSHAGQSRVKSVISRSPIKTGLQQ